jgi:hypothetical protein
VSEIAISNAGINGIGPEVGSAGAVAADLVPHGMMNFVGLDWMNLVDGHF